MHGDRVGRMAALVATIAQHQMGRKPALRVVKPDSDADEKALYAAWRGYQTEADTLTMPDVDTSPRGIQTRAIKRIMHAYPWGADAVRFFLDTRGLAYISELNDTQLDDLQYRMDGYVDAAMTGCDSIDAPPAT